MRSWADSDSNCQPVADRSNGAEFDNRKREMSLTSMRITLNHERLLTT
jgi:hypothetical protein